MSPAYQRDNDQVSNNNDDDSATTYEHDQQNRNANTVRLPSISSIYPAYERDRYQVSTNYKYDSSIAYDHSQHNGRYYTQMHTANRASASQEYNRESYQVKRTNQINYISIAYSDH